MINKYQVVRHLEKNKVFFKAELALKCKKKKSLFYQVPIPFIIAVIKLNEKLQKKLENILTFHPVGIWGMT